MPRPGSERDIVDDMTAPRIDLHIEELMLDGVEQAHVAAVVEAVTSALAGHLVRSDVAARFTAGAVNELSVPDVRVADPRRR